MDLFLILAVVYLVGCGVTSYLLGRLKLDSDPATVVLWPVGAVVLLVVLAGLLLALPFLCLYWLGDRHGGGS